MKRILVIAALLGVMFALDALRVKSGAMTNPVTLAAIGFVVLAAFASAELGSSIGLPRVTGYILAGAALGPSLGNILSGQVVTDMRMFNTLALGLIATSAGLELDVRQLLRLGKTLTATIFIKVLLGLLLVGGTMLGLANLFDLGLPAPDESSSPTLALALIMGVLSIGTSPAIALAVLNETRAKGRLSDLVLGAAVFKDLVVVVSLAIAIAVARSLLVPGSELDAAVLVHVAEELGGSLVAGTVLGAVLIAYMRFIKAEMLLFVAAMILVVAELCRVLHLELLLVFITAGFVVRNLSKYEHDLMEPLELVALPVFVVFFTNAGAGIDLLGTWRILPLALALCAVRAGGYYLAGRFGAFVGKESPAVAGNAWYAYLPQAGVTLGLVGLAAQQLPAIGGAIATTGMAVVAINLLIGPVTLRKALTAAREVPGQDNTEPAVPAANAEQSAPPPRQHHGAAGAQSQRVLDEPALAERFTDLRNETLGVLDDFRTKTLSGLPLLPLTTAEPRLEDFERFVVAHRRACRALFDDLVARLATLPSTVTAPLRLESLEPTDADKWVMRTRLWGHRLRHRLLSQARRRDVAVRLGARMTLERGFAELASAVFERSIFQHLSEFERRATGKPEDDSDDAYLRQQLRELVDEHFEDFADLLLRMGTPRCPNAALRFSSVEPTIRAAMEALEADQEDFWSRRAQAVWGSALAHSHATKLEQSVRRALAQNVLEPAKTAQAHVGPAFQRLTASLEQFRKGALEGVDANLVGEVVRWRHEMDALRHEALDELSRELRASSAMRALANELREAMSTLPTEVRCLQLNREQSPREGSIRRVELRSLAERYWVRGLVPSIDQATRAISNAFAQLPRRVKEALEPSWTLLEALAEQSSPENFRQRAADELALAVHRVELTEQRTQRQLDANHQSINNAVEHARKALLDHVELQGTDATTRRRLVERLVERERARIVALLDWLKRYGPRTPKLRDATDLRVAVERWHGDRLPSVVARWFSQAPVRDERIFTAQRELLELIVDEETQWLAGRRSAVLLRGGIGTGKSSLLNMSELELRSARVIRLDAEGSEQSGSCFEALGLVFGCSADEPSLVRQLALYRPAVLLDNLDVWLARAQGRKDELNRLLSLITQTRRTAFWVMAVDRASLEVFEEISNVAEVFTRILDCRPLSVGEVSELVEARRQRAGVDFIFPRTLMGELLSRSGLGGENELFFRALTRVSNGNPGRALAEFARAASIRDDNVLLSTATLRGGRARIAQSLTTAQVAVLATIVRHGSGDISHLRRELGLQFEQLERHLSFLLGAGLLSTGAEGHTYEVPEEARWPVVLELQRLGALGSARS